MSQLNDANDAPSEQQNDVELLTEIFATTDLIPNSIPLAGRASKHTLNHVLTSAAGRTSDDGIGGTVAHQVGGADTGPNRDSQVADKDDNVNNVHEENNDVNDFDDHNLYPTKGNPKLSTNTHVENTSTKTVTSESRSTTKKTCISFRTTSPLCSSSTTTHTVTSNSTPAGNVVRSTIPQAGHTVC